MENPRKTLWKLLKDFRFRHIFMLYGGILVVLILLFTDPSTGVIRQLPFGSQTLTQLTGLWKMVLYVGMLHFGLRALFDYIDKEQLFNKAVETAEGAGRALMALGLFAIAVAIVTLAAVMS